LTSIATREGAIHKRALALWYAPGTNRRPSTLVSRRGEPRLVFDSLCEVGWPHSIIEVAREGFRRVGEMLCPLVALLSQEPREPSQIQSDDFPPEIMIDGVPNWSMDVYTRQGRAAFARFLQTDAADCVGSSRSAALTGTSPVGGKHTYTFCLGKDRSPRESRRSISSTE
jgi:hypothetical protein